MKSLVILSSSRRESNTRLLIKKLFSEDEIEVIDLLDFNIFHYDYKGNYPEKDQFFEVIQALVKYDTIIFASPVYWYSMSGILKVFFDRLTDIATVKKHIGRSMKGKRIFLVSVGTDTVLPKGFEIPFRLTAEYFNMNFIATYYCPTKNLKSNLDGKKEFLNNIKSK